MTAFLSMPTKSKVNYRNTVRGVTTKIKEAGSTYSGAAELVRTTIDLEPELHRRLKVYAAQQGVKIADLVRRWVDQHCV